MDILTLIQNSQEKCLNGEKLDSDTILSLLAISPYSEEALILRKAAHQVSLILTKSKGYLWCSIGLDYIPCSMNCSFCSFGEAWNLIKNPSECSDEQLCAIAKDYADHGAEFIALRTTEFYGIKKLEEKIRMLRQNVPGRYKLIANTGEMTPAEAESLHSAGLFGAYHTIRLREGTDTFLTPSRRRKTMHAITSSPLQLSAHIEPIAPEHTDEEIVTAFENILSAGTELSGLMARIPVKGTPLGNRKQISMERLNQLAAIVRLSGGTQIKDVCIHPSTPETFTSGANVVVVERGSNPRTTDLSTEDWREFGFNTAKQYLLDAGFSV